MAYAKLHFVSCDELPSAHEFTVTLSAHDRNKNTEPLNIERLSRQLHHPATNLFQQPSLVHQIQRTTSYKYTEQPPWPATYPISRFSPKQCTRHTAKASANPYRRQTQPTQASLLHHQPSSAPIPKHRGLLASTVIRQNCPNRSGLPNYRIPWPKRRRRRGRTLRPCRPTLLTHILLCLKVKHLRLHLQLWAAPEVFDRDRLSPSSNMAVDLRSPSI